MNLGVPELLVVLTVVLLLFGAQRLPKLARSLGDASREFRNGVNSRDDATPDQGQEGSASASEFGRAGESYGWRQAPASRMTAPRPNSLLGK